MLLPNKVIPKRREDRSKTIKRSNTTLLQIFLFLIFKSIKLLVFCFGFVLCGRRVPRPKESESKRIPAGNEWVESQ